jgi:hypothetical protein
MVHRLPDELQGWHLRAGYLLHAVHLLLLLLLLPSA